MNVIEFAREIESREERMYREMAEESPIEEIRSIFGFLAREEKLHDEVLQVMSQQTSLPPIEKSSILRDSQEVFKNLSKQFTKPGTIAIDREYPLGTALELESKTLSLYEKAIAELPDNPDNERTRQILYQLVEQEQNHVRLVESLKDFQRHPYEWLENAEWYHLDEY
jgi:rubrerythrin